jgi:hypothetical protein
MAFKPKIKKRFKREFRRQLRMAISAAIGFIIAFSWKETIVKLIEKQVQQLTTMTSALNVSFASSLITTALGAVIIILSSQLLKER